MKALDTNMLVRFLVNDDKTQAALVHKIFTRAENTRQTFFVSSLVILELIWVLESAYETKRKELIDTLNELLLLPILDFENRQALQATLKHASEDSSDLSDQLIAQVSRVNGCESILTFDKKASKKVGFELITSI